MIRTKRRFFSRIVLGLLLSSVFLAQGSGQTPSAKEDKDKAKLEVVTYQQLIEVVKSHLGKVVVIDVWDSG